MTITTKFNVGDKVWIVFEDRLVEWKIDAISIGVPGYSKPEKIVYEFSYGQGEPWYRDEENCWLTPNEFISQSVTNV